MQYEDEQTTDKEERKKVTEPQRSDREKTHEKLWGIVTSATTPESVPRAAKATGLSRAGVHKYLERLVEQKVDERLTKKYSSNGEGLSIWVRDSFPPRKWFKVNNGHSVIETLPPTKSKPAHHHIVLREEMSLNDGT